MSSLFFLVNEKKNNNKAQGLYNFNIQFGYSRYTFFDVFHRSYLPYGEQNNSHSIQERWKGHII